MKRTLLLAAVLLVCSLSAHAGTLYWGGTNENIANGTPLPTSLAGLAGTWDLTLKNWSTNDAGTTYTNWSNSGTENTAWLGYNLSSAAGGETVMLDTDLTLNSIRASWSLSSYGQHLDIDSTAPRTITFNGDNPSVELVTGHSSRHYEMEDSISAVGSSGLTCSGSGGLYIYGDWSGLTGVITNSMSLLWVDANGTGNSGDMSGISRFDVLDTGSLQIDGFDGANDVLGDTASVHLRGMTARFDFHGYGSAGYSESISKLVLGSHGILDIRDRSGGSTPAGKLTLIDGIDRGPDGKGTMFVDVQSDNSIRSTVVDTAGTASSRLPWAITTLATGVGLNASKEIETIAAVSAPTDPSSWVGGSEYVIDATIVAPVNSIAINALGIIRNASETLTINAGQVLTITQGTLGRANGGGANTYTITGGQITSGVGELYLFAAQNANQTLKIESEITGDINVITAGGSQNQLVGPGANTYTGTTYINAGTTLAGKPDNVICIPGDLVVGADGILITGGDNQINSNATVTVREYGRLSFGDTDDQTFHGVVTIEGGTFTYSYADPIIFNHPASAGLVFNGGELRAVRSDSGPPLQILTDVKYEATASRQAQFTSARTEGGNEHNLHLSTADTGSSEWTWDIADSSALSADLPEMTVDLMLIEVATGNPPVYNAPSGLVKTGGGALQLQQFTDWLSGTNTVNNGTLIANGGYARCVVQTGDVVLNSPVVSNLTTTNGLAVGQWVYGPFSSNRQRLISIDSATQVTLGGNAYGTANGATITFLGGSAVGIGPVNVNNTGTFGGNGAGGLVTVASGGTLDPGGFNHQLGTMTGEDVDIQSGATFAVDLSGSGNDLLQVWGDLTIAGNVSPTLAAGYEPAGNTQWTIVTVIGGGAIDLTGITADEGYMVEKVGNDVILSNPPQGTVVQVM